MSMLLYVMAMSLIINLSITLLFELVTALLWGLRTARAVIVVALANLATNPPLTALMVCLNFTAMGEDSIWLLLLFEPLIVLIEGYVYSRVLPSVRHPYWFSLAANFASGVLGMLI